jgi:alkanesulfonate monooxygenase SsuD/methylene tetrahydromethanopterin reductase-like flavin-dependent oxidoreductase (luciferase family)
MQIYAGMDQRTPLAEIGNHARRVEAMGYDGLNVPDAVHDGLLAAQAALQATTRLRVATSVLVCFPRSPMNAAHAAWDLQAFSGGRFELGLGTQVRGNIVGRYSTPWTPPVPRMREYVQSLRAIWDCWQNGGPPHRAPRDSHLPGRGRTEDDGPRRRGRRRNHDPPHQRRTALPARGRAPRDGEGRPAGRALAAAARTRGGRLRRHRRDTGGRRPRAREDPGTPDLSLLDTRLLADPRALQLGRRRSESAPADARRALDRHGRGDHRRDAQRVGAPGNLRRDRGHPARVVRRARRPHHLSRTRRRGRRRESHRSPTASPFPYPTTRAPTRKPPR